MTNFIKSIKYDRAAKRANPLLTGQRVFIWDTPLTILSFEQKTSLRYRVANREHWTFELGRYDTFEGSTSNEPTSTHWGATLWNSDWDRILGYNSDLKIGQPANWAPTLANFFPVNPHTRDSVDELTGFRQYLENMTTIVGFLDRIKMNALPGNEGVDRETFDGKNYVDMGLN